MGKPISHKKIVQLAGSQLTPDESKKKMLELLYVFDKFCQEHNLTYWLDSGTLLGAVRHSGFIPWDDDVDIMMPRDDYNKLIAYDCIDDKTDIVSAKNNNGYYHPFTFCKISNKETISIIEDSNRNTGRGQFIDVFPLDNVPDDIDERKIYFSKLNTLQKIKGCAIRKYRKGGIKICIVNAITFILRPFSRFFLMQYIDKYAQKYNKFDTAIWGQISSSTNECYQWKKEAFSSTKRIIFEGEMLCVPNDTDYILQHEYGEYMKYPPEDQRVPKHDMKIYWKK